MGKTNTKWTSQSPPRHSTTNRSQQEKPTKEGVADLIADATSAIVKAINTHRISHQPRYKGCHQ